MRLLPAIVTRSAASAWSSFVTTFKPVTDTMVGFVREPFAGAWQRNMEIDAMSGLTAFSAVFACISRISNDIAKLKPLLKEEMADGTSQLANKESPFWLVLRKPNGFQNRIQFLAYWLTCKLLHGNAYALKLRDARNMVQRLFILDPRRVVPLVTPEGDVYYSLSGDNLAKIPTGMVVPASEIIHDRINCLWHPLVGISPIYACGVSATQGRRIQDNSGKFFANMSRPSGMLTAPGTIDEITALRLKTDFETNFGGGNIGRLAVLGDGLKYEAMSMPAEQSQLIEQLQWTVEDVARAFGMPLYKIGAGPMPTNNNVEALNQQYYDDCLQVYIEAIELCLNEGLGVPANMGVELDLDGLLRMDKASQIDMLEKAVKGLMKPDEARKRLNLPPVPGGDTIYLQEQNYSLAALARRDARPDPFAKGSPAPAPAPAAPAQAPAAAPEPDDKDYTLEVIADLVAAAKALPPLHEEEEAAHA